MNVLYIAYSCAPNKGSEDKLGWNIPMESAKTNRVYVITKEEHRQSIEQYLQQNGMKHVTFYFVDIPDIYKKLYKGFLYSGRLNIWHRRALPVAKKICEEHQIDVIHQITPIEFRSIGMYGKIPNVKFVCGPLGGGEMLPKGLKSYAKGHMMVENVRSIMNYWSLCKFKLTGTLKHCDHILFANRETKKFMSSVNPELDRCAVVTEIAIDENDVTDAPGSAFAFGKPCRFLVAGRLIYRKGHKLLLDALSQIPEEIDYTCRIVGDGPELEQLKEKCADSVLSQRVVFAGKLPYSQMAAEYENADVFIMPSLRETTGSVLLEAMAKGLPTITINKYGGALLLDRDCGWLYEGYDEESYIESLKNAILDCICNPEEVRCRGNHARKKAEQYTWERKTKHYHTIYGEILRR